MDSIAIGQMNEANDLGVDVSEVGCNCNQRVGCAGFAPFTVNGDDEFDNAIEGDERFDGFVGLDDEMADLAQIGFSFPNPIKAISHAVNDVSNFVSKVPVLSQVSRLAVSPIHVIKNIAKGERLDHVLVGELKTTAKQAKDLAPYVQTVISVVPGIGTGLSAGLGGALALAQGKTITQAVMEAAKSAIPGGPAAQAAFSIAAGVMEGKPIEQIALGALPIDENAKKALMKGLVAARALASGQPVNKVLMNEAMTNLPDSVKKALQVGTALGHAKFLQGVAGEKLSKLAANTLLKSGGLSSLQKVLANPVVSSVMGPVSIPGPLLLAVVKGSPTNAVKVAMDALKDPNKQAAVRASALLFSHNTPQSVAFAEVAKVVDALRSKDATAAVKAAAQIAATTALSQSGVPEATKALDLINRAKTIAKRLPVATDLTNLTHGRVEVCGAKSDEHRGVWLKSHIYRDGNYLCMTVYSVANANAEVFNFKLDLVPILKQVALYHKKLHGAAPVVGSGIGDVMNRTAVKLGRAKLAQKAFTVSSHLAAKAACNVQTPNVPVSNAVLATYAAARAGVDAVDKNAKLKRAMESVGGNVAKLVAVKKHLASLDPAHRAAALRDPTIRAAILSGIGSKIALAKFVKAGGPKVAKDTRRNAIIASKQFSTLAAKVRAGDPNAKKMAAVISVAAKARAKTQQTVQRGTHGSSAGFVITAQGKVRKSPAGFQKRTPRAGERSEVLVRPHGVIETGVFDVAGDDEIGAVKKKVVAARKKVAAARKKVAVARKVAAVKKVLTSRRVPTAAKVALLKRVRTAQQNAAYARANTAQPTQSPVQAPVQAPSQFSDASQSVPSTQPSYEEPEETYDDELEESSPEVPEDEPVDDGISDPEDDDQEDISGSSNRYTTRLQNRLAHIRKLAVISGGVELSNAFERYFPQLSQAEKRYLIKQNAAWAEKVSESQLARERVQAILARRRSKLRVGESEEGESDIGGRHTGTMTARTLAALKKDLHAYNASAYPVGATHVRQLLMNHHGMSERGANRVIAALQRQGIKVGVENEDGEVDYESELPYDIFVQDPFREDQVQADLAY